MKIYIKKLTVIAAIFLVFIGCDDKSISGDKVDLTSLKGMLLKTDTLKDSYFDRQITDSIPNDREDLNSMRLVVKIHNGQDDAGITIPGFGGLTLGKKESNLNVYYVETKIVKTASDTLVYGIGYSIHYLFKKLKSGIEVTNLASVAASAQLQSNRTSVYYSMQSFGVRSLELVKYFKPKVNSNFDVEGFGVIQSSIDGIHNVLSDSLLSNRTSFNPMPLKFIRPIDLQQ